MGKEQQKQEIIVTHQIAEYVRAAARSLALTLPLALVTASSAMAAPLSSFAEKDKAGTVLYALDSRKFVTSRQSCLYDDKTCFLAETRDKTGNTELLIERADGKKTIVLLPSEARMEAVPHLWPYSLTLPAQKASDDQRSPIIIGVINSERANLESGPVLESRLSLYQLTFRGTAADPIYVADELLSLPHRADRDGKTFESMLTLDTSNAEARPVLIYHGVATKGDEKLATCSFERRFTFNPLTSRYEASEPGPACPPAFFTN